MGGMEGFPCIKKCLTGLAGTLRAGLRLIKNFSPTNI